MSETHFDEYEHYNFTEENKIHSNHSGRLRTKKVIRIVCYSPLLCSEDNNGVLCFRKLNFTQTGSIPMGTAGRL